MVEQRRWYALAREALVVHALALPGATELAAWGAFLAHVRLQRSDEALQLGERYLRDHPEGAHYADVKRQMNAIVEERRAHAIGPTARRRAYSH